MIDRLKELLNKKELIVTTPEDKEKIQVIKDLFQDEAIFFKIDAETALGILEFLGIPESQMKEIYLTLISPKEYQKVSKQYFVLK